MRSPELTEAEKTGLSALEPRIGKLHLRQRLGLEQDYESRVFHRGTHFFHLENWYSFHGWIRAALRLTGLHRRGRQNAVALEVRRESVYLDRLPRAFDGFTLLHLSDLHVDMRPDFVPALLRCIAPLQYDLTVMTGDYRAQTFGPFSPALAGMRELRAGIRGDALAVLGNHDTIRMVPELEGMGYRVLINELAQIKRDGATLYFSGIDDAHYFRMENFHRAAGDIPPGECSVLLSHTPETYRHAAHAGFALMLCGHTHGGQICLPGGVPILTDADCPRSLARGRWDYNGMMGYTSTGAGTSIVDVRLNCPPEVTLLKLRAGPA